MEKKLRKSAGNGLHHFVDGVRIAGAPSGLRGDVDDLRGDVDECGLTKEERDEGVDVQDLIAEES